MVGYQSGVVIIGLVIQSESKILALSWLRDDHTFVLLFPRRRQGRCTICGGPGISDAYYCRECTQQEKDRDGCPKIVNLGSSKTVSTPYLFGRMIILLILQCKQEWHNQRRFCVAFSLANGDTWL